MAKRKGDNVISGLGFQTRELSEWKIVHDEDIFRNKRVVVFALPGAFTPTCTNEQLPKYEEKYEEFTEKHSIDEVYCLSVNDSFVMNAWFDALDIKKVKAIPDGSGRFSRWMGMLVDKDNLGFGYRSWRYAMVVNDGIIEEAFVEAGFSNNIDSDPYVLSDPQTVLNYLSGRGTPTAE